MRLENPNHTHKNKKCFESIKQMAHKRKKISNDLKKVGAMTAGTDLGKICKAVRKK
jgi:hypothetical protein